MNPLVQGMNRKRERQVQRRIAVLKRVLRDLAQLPQTSGGIGDREELELMIRELGGDERKGAHREIRKAKERDE